MPDPISTLALATGGAFLGKFVGPAAEHLGKLALERAQQLGQKATAILATVGREPQPVEPKLLVPLVQAASLEADESLADKWAALLANAADPAQKVKVRPSFAEALRLLTPADAQLLEFIYADHPPQSGDIFCHFPTVEDASSHFGWNDWDMEIALDNLFRLRLFELPGGSLYTNENALGVTQRFVFTAYGGQFLHAITPPTA